MRAAPLCLPLLLILAAPCFGGEIEVRHTNDLFADSPIEDDLYTATFGIGGTVGDWTIDLDENLFTDRTNNLRFDETYLTLSRSLVSSDASWRVRASAGWVHVGEGLFGQGAQNFIHRLLGESEVDFPYVTNSQSHLFLQLRVARPFSLTPHVYLAPRLELESAVFKQHARAAVGFGWSAENGFGLNAEAGFRYSETNFAPLLPWIDESAPTYAFGANWRRLVSLTWTENAFGTGDRHWTLVLRFQVGAG